MRHVYKAHNNKHKIKWNENKPDVLNVKDVTPKFMWDFFTLWTHDLSPHSRTSHPPHPQCLSGSRFPSRGRSVRVKVLRWERQEAKERERERGGLFCTPRQWIWYHFLLVGTGQKMADFIYYHEMGLNLSPSCSSSQRRSSSVRLNLHLRSCLSEGAWEELDCFTFFSVLVKLLDKFLFILNISDVFSKE